jgi:micrococcal nuclease
MLESCITPVVLEIADGVVISPTAVPTQPGLLYDPIGPDRDCGDFTVWEDVYAFYLAAGGPASDPHRLDPDGDGTPCEGLK